MLRHNLRPMVKTSNAWVCFMDIYGFSYMVDNLSPQELEDFHQRLVNCYIDTKAANSVKTIKCYFFSDSIFIINLVKKNKSTALNHLISFVKNVMGIFFNAGFPLRGCIYYGNISCQMQLTVNEI